MEELDGSPSDGAVGPLLPLESFDSERNANDAKRKSGEMSQQDDESCNNEERPQEISNEKATAEQIATLRRYIEDAIFHGIGDLEILREAIEKGKKPKGKLFSVDRIIERKKTAHSWEYLIKWTGWPLYASSWEPSDHLTHALLQSYENPPKPDQNRIEQASRSFYEAITKSLKGKSTAPVCAQIDLDVQRWLWKGKGIPSEHRGYKLYEKEDFGNLILQETWWYHLDSNCEGKAIDFPMKMKPALLWTPKHYIFQNGELKQAERLPVEKAKVHFARRACNVNTL